MWNWNYNHQQAGEDARAPAGGQRVEEGAKMSSMQSVLGSIVSLWRYPVKSMMGEELNAAEVTKGGLLGDRLRAHRHLRWKSCNGQEPAEVATVVRLSRR